MGTDGTYHSIRAGASVVQRWRSFPCRPCQEIAKLDRVSMQNNSNCSDCFDYNKAIGVRNHDFRFQPTSIFTEGLMSGLRYRKAENCTCTSTHETTLGTTTA
jgi:hypothetical protein